MKTTVNEDEVDLDQIQVARYLRSKGRSLREVGRIMGKATSTVQRWCEEAGPRSSVISPPVKSLDNRSALMDHAGNPLALMNSEADFMCAYGKDLIRKNKGCDFRDPDTKDLIEVKGFAVNPRQCFEMAQEFVKDKRRAILASVQDDVVLIFRLENILRIPRPQADEPILTAPILDEHSSGSESVLSRVGVLDDLAPK